VYVGGGVIVEAEPGGARRDRLSKYASFDVVWLTCPARRGPAVAVAARELIGTPYSFLDYAALATHRLHIPAPGLRHYIGDSGHLICSQLADEAARRGGWHLYTDNRWPGYVTPGALFELARATGAQVTRIAGPKSSSSSVRLAGRMS
jgi:hypothetical protein